MNDSHLISRGASLDQLIPHRPPMLLVESLERVEGNDARLRAVIQPDSLFAHPDGSIEPLALLELMAQSCAVYGGFRAKAAQQDIQAAFLVGVRSFETMGQAKSGRAMDVCVTLVREFGGFHLFEASLSQDDREVARAQLKAYHSTEGPSHE